MSGTGSHQAWLTRECWESDQSKGASEKSSDFSPTTLVRTAMTVRLPPCGADCFETRVAPRSAAPKTDGTTRLPG